MYEAFYGLREKPFSILPDPDLIYWGESHRLALAMLEFGVLNNAGFTVITGDVGSGKTTILRFLLRRLDPKIVVAMISNTPAGGEGLLGWVLMALGQPFEEVYQKQFKRFQQYLFDEFRRGRRVVLIVDEAQNLGIKALEELRMLSNVNADKSQFLQIILVGQPQLKEKLRMPELLQFAQRVSSDFHLKPLSASDVNQYIHFRLKAVGSKAKLFSDQACDVISQASRGIPRTINIICDTALVYGYAAEAKSISPDMVRLVIENKAAYGVLPLASVGRGGTDGQVIKIKPAPRATDK
jgi:type II secretory pathway predicted ATPase ExeA